MPDRLLTLLGYTLGLVWLGAMAWALLRAILGRGPR